MKKILYTSYFKKNRFWVTAHRGICTIKDNSILNVFFILGGLQLNTKNKIKMFGNPFMWTP